MQASSVVRVVVGARNSPFIPHVARGALGSHRGEALVADLVDGRYLFALLKGRNGVYDVTFRQTRAAFTELESVFRDDGTIRWGRAVERAVGPRDLPPEAYPILVSFTDLSDPTSVFEVDASDLAASVGAGYALERITLEITDEPVTMGSVAQLLPWLPDRIENLRPTEAEFAADVLPIETIGRPSFIKGN